MSKLKMLMLFLVLSSCSNPSSANVKYLHKFKPIGINDVYLCEDYDASYNTYYLYDCIDMFGVKIKRVISSNMEYHGKVEIKKN